MIGCKREGFGNAGNVEFLKEGFAVKPDGVLERKSCSPIPFVVNPWAVNFRGGFSSGLRVIASQVCLQWLENVIFHVAALSESGKTVEFSSINIIYFSMETLLW